MHRVLDRLMLSDLSEANDPYFLEQHDVQAVLHFGDGGMFPDDIKLYHRVPESGSGLTPQELRDGVEFLRESLRAGRRVLAVGGSGATITAAYLSEMGFSTAQSIQMLQAATGASPGPDTKSLKQHERELRRRSEATLGH